MRWRLPLPLRLPLIAAFAIMACTAGARAGNMAYQAKGEFTVMLKPVSAEGESPARFSIDKIFSGDLTGSSIGQMMAGGVEENGTRVYVALETVTGELQGREGSFILAHRGTMAKDGQSLSVIIVPDSGTGELAGISGALEIEIEDGRHLYVLDYDLPQP